nr:DUF4333 domain-containing protein [Kofleriaceae bacterium]
MLLLGAGIGVLTRKTVDNSDMQRQIMTWASNLETVKSVDCPPNVKEKAGDNYDCKVTFEAGHVATVHVVQEDNHGKYQMYWSPAIASGPQAAAMVSASLTGTWKGAAVDCGKGILDVPDAGLSCSVAQGAAREHVQLLIHDGNVSTRVQP